MEPQVRSSARATGRRRTILLRALALACLLAVLLFSVTEAYTLPQVNEQLRFQITDSTDDRPIPGATVALVYWQRTDSRLEKKEVEIKSDKNGIAKFSPVEAEKLAVSVNLKGFRPCWRWLRTNSPPELTRIRLDRWANRPK
jgi:hypothetical protein